VAGVPQQPAKPITKKRIQPRVDIKIVRLAKSKAALQELSLEYVIEQLLTGWVAGRITLEQPNQEGKS
jgi:hypothetical protein